MALGEESIRRRSDTGKAREFQLQLDAGVLLAGAAADEAPAHQPQPQQQERYSKPAKRSSALSSSERIDVAGVERSSACADRPGGGELSRLLEAGRAGSGSRALTTCSRAGWYCRFTWARSLRWFVGIPLQADVRVPVLEGGEGELRDEVRAACRSRGVSSGSMHARGLRSSRSGRGWRRETAAARSASSRRLVTPTLTWLASLTRSAPT